VISKEQMIPLLLQVCPSFQSKWQELKDDHEDELPYICCGKFAAHLLELYKNSQTSEFPAVADVIEQLHVEGDGYVKEAATIGILEGIQNVWGNNDADPENFVRFLKPESKKWWYELNAFWNGERRYVGEGLQKQLTPEDIKIIKKETEAFNDSLNKRKRTF